MAGQRLPFKVIEARGKKHFTKAEKEERQKQEIQPIADNIIAPSYLTKKQKEEFDKIAEQLTKLEIMGETDCDALARYIIANDLYQKAVKQLRSRDVLNDPFMFDHWSKIQERQFKQVRSAANDLGLSISSRCKLVIPQIKKEEEPENKFKRFEKGAG